MSPAAQRLAGVIEHTLLRPETTPEQVERLCDECVEYGFAGVCVNPVFVRLASGRLAKAGTVNPSGRPPFVVSVAGFPLGANQTRTKADEARRAIDEGASEIDMVANIGALVAGDGPTARGDILAVASVVHQAAPNGLLKVIVETAVLTREQLVLACRCCAEGEADFVKTSTGLHSAGGATVEAVRELRRLASPLGVKAAGGIRRAEQVQALLEAGASRIGTSAGVSILRELA